MDNWEIRAEWVIADDSQKNASQNGRPPKIGSIVKALRRSPLVGADVDLSRKNRWDDLFDIGRVPVLIHERA